MKKWMLRSAGLFAVVLAGWVQMAAAAELPRLATAARVLGADTVTSLTFTASGRYYQFGQAPAPELSWPPFTVDNYLATLDFVRATVHARYHRTQVQEPGRARPPAEQTMDQYLAGGETWNLTPALTPIPANLAERYAELWASPQGFVKAARARAATVTPAGHGDSQVSFALADGSRYEGLINAAGEVVRVRAWLDSAVLGDTMMEFRYSDYQRFGDVLFPAHIERRIAGEPWYDLRVSDVKVNAAAALEVPPGLAAARAASATTEVRVEELAPGVFNFTGTTHNSVVIEQSAGIVVVEAPLSEARSEAVLAKIRAQFPGRKIRYVINTHTHFDHASGLRTYVDEGITVVTHARNAKYFARVWAAPRTLNPDRLARSGRTARFRTFTEKLVLADAARPVEVHSIQGSGHNDAFAMIWLPAQKILIEADAFTPPAAGARLSALPNPLWVNLLANIERLGLAVQKIAPLHGVPQTLEDLRSAVAPH